MVFDQKTVEWFGPHFTGNEGRYINTVIRSGYINDGPMTRELEGKISELTSSKYAVAVTSGTAAIALSLIAAGINPNDEVIVPNLTFAATANAVVLMGAKPVLVDVESNSFCINLEAAKRAITSKTTAIIAVDVNGRCGNYTALNKMIVKNGLILICDSAEALGSKSGTRAMGTFGSAGCFSFSANKTISAGQGGMVVTDSKKIFDRLKELKDQGRRKQGSGGDDAHPSVGFNFKFTDIQAAFALSQFEDFQSRLSAARVRDEMYRHYLSDIDQIQIPRDGHSDGEVIQWFDILMNDRTHVQNCLAANGYSTRVFWRPLNSHGIYKFFHECPISENISQKGLWLPSRYDIAEEDIQGVAKTIKHSQAKKYRLN